MQVEIEHLFLKYVVRRENMNCMDDGENNDSMKPIHFETIDVDYNISLVEAIKLSVENSGYEAEIIKESDETYVDIKIPFLVGTENDKIELMIYKWWYYVCINVDIRGPNTLEEKLAILECVNNCSGLVGYTWRNEYQKCYICIDRCGRRLDAIDMYLERGHINIGSADVASDEGLAQEKLAPKDIFSVYTEQHIDFNLSGKWNATKGTEYTYILDDINYLVSTVQEDRDCLRQFI